MEKLSARSPHPALRPVELLKDGLKVLHGAVCDQHDGLVTHAALTVRPRLHTNAQLRHSNNSIIDLYSLKRE